MFPKLQIKCLVSVKMILVLNENVADWINEYKFLTLTEQLKRKIT